MKYTHHEGVVKKHNSHWLAASTVLAVSAGYLLINAYWPALPISGTSASSIVSTLTNAKPEAGSNRLYVPQLGLNLPIAEGASGVQDVSKDGSSPAQGGNFVLAGSKFQLGATPMQTQQKSPFYRLDKLKSGDEIYVDYSGKRYVYKITSIDKKQPANNTSTPLLTLYSTKKPDSNAPLSMVTAEPVGTVAWVNGKAQLDN